MTETMVKWSIEQGVIAFVLCVVLYMIYRGGKATGTFLKDTAWEKFVAWLDSLDNRMDKQTEAMTGHAAAQVDTGRKLTDRIGKVDDTLAEQGLTLGRIEGKVDKGHEATEQVVKFLREERA